MGYAGVGGLRGSSHISPAGGCTWPTMKKAGLHHPFALGRLPQLHLSRTDSSLSSPPRSVSEIRLLVRFTQTVRAEMGNKRLLPSSLRKEDTSRWRRGGRGEGHRRGHGTESPGSRGGRGLMEGRPRDQEVPKGPQQEASVAASRILSNFGPGMRTDSPGWRNHHHCPHSGR